MYFVDTAHTHTQHTHTDVQDKGGEEGQAAVQPDAVHEGGGSWEDHARKGGDEDGAKTNGEGTTCCGTRKAIAWCEWKWDLRMCEGTRTKQGVPQERKRSLGELAATRERPPTMPPV